MNPPVNLQDAFDALNIQIWTAGQDGVLDFVNSCTVNYFGRSREQLISAGWQSVLHSADVPAATEQWARAVEGGEPYEIEIRLLRDSDRTNRWHRASAVRLLTENGPRWFGSNVDIDAARRATEVIDAARATS